ncbi:MAG: hypothetical protein A3A58_02455 [Candidatus Blackburnbacteria bacterium RIFCSPLOWO2_01_FULL_41_27]|uniref:Type 4 fimbrial biogenesis protein PilX N-terminal domain-containing protein n=2 Tax=Candidatus Blackburniibacteriota TaxID=1817898 RepID=A0A1G1VHA9_9BACT|nr:MAG: hypothetical protein A3A58_02455 [Candidatus Blackburnbacteria bacterium RIFCSPLOWO2_01_FULL_41_27]
MRDMLAIQRGSLAQRGQALVVIVLIMAVVLTIALSVVSRTVSDINISTKEDDSSRAFSAAEAGIEQALLKGTPQTFEAEVGSTGSFNATISQLTSGGTEFAVPILLSSGEIAPVWLVEHDDTTSELICSDLKPCFTGDDLKVCWGEPGTPSDSSTTPALEVSVVYTDSDSDFSTTKIARAAYDPHPTRANNFTKGADSGEAIDGQAYQFCRTVDLTSLGVTIRPTVNARRGPQYARLRMLYNTTQSQPAGVKIVGTENLPLQGQKVVSTGTSGEAQRSLEVYKLFSDLPPIFDYTLFSGVGGIVK